MHAALRLPVDFDAAGLQIDLDRVLSEPWTNHFNDQIFDGDWSGIPLRGPANALHPIQALHNAPGITEFADQPILDECIHFRAVMDRIACPLTSVRLLRLGPGSKIGEHADHELNYQSGVARLHVPIMTNPEVDFRTAGRRVDMRPGELWYLDASQPHAVTNGGCEARVHLVLDCQVTPWLRGLLEDAETHQPILESAGPIEPEPSAAVTPAPARSRYWEPVTQRIVAFLEQIGFELGTRAIPKNTVLPGIEVEYGKIWIDPERLSHPGDLLHEAGHIAVAPAEERSALTGEVSKDPGMEMAAIAWSWAALTHLDLEPEELFHPDGYKNDSQWLIEMYGGGTYIALPTLQWIGLTADPKRAEELGVAPYPHMLRWLRD